MVDCSIASVWRLASTKGLIFLADAQIADPDELQVLDIFLAIKLVVRASSPDAPDIPKVVCK